MKYITRTVWILSLVSLFTDTASEMLYPVMPIYLKSIGFSVVLIGLLEGIAEGTAGLSKGYFGKLSDNSGRRSPFVQLGYSLSALSKPMMALFTYPLWIFFARTADRIGKGLRTGARDAILSDEATPETKGRVFGLHRSMDTLGAVLGPSIALAYLYYFPHHYKLLFYIAFIPGLLAVITTLLIKDKKQSEAKPFKLAPFFSFINYWKGSPAMYKKIVAGLLAFTLFNSSDAFLLLKAKQAGLDDTMVIGVYIFYNLVYAALGFPMGVIADRYSLKKVFIAGLICFAITYFGMAFTLPVYGYLALFFVYGLYAAATEGISKAWISNITDKKDTATAIGTYTGLQSICTMGASFLAGIVWYNFGAAATFITSAAVTVLVIVYFILFIPKPKE